MDVLVSKLDTKDSLSWIVADCPVVAVFENIATKESDSLGQPSDRNGCSDLLRLWIGMNEDTRELFVTLTIRVRPSTVRKKTRRHGRLMFLVVPAESLHLQSESVTFADLESKLPSKLFDVPDDVQSRKSELLRVSFDLGTLASDVIMPEYQCRQNVMPQAIVLLRKLKTLAETSSFYLYTNFDEANYAAIKRLGDVQLDGYPMFTPSVDLKGFYSGGRSACKNSWLDQGWSEEPKTEHKNTDKRPCKDQTEILNQLHPQPPPPYEPESVLPSACLPLYQGGEAEALTAIASAPRAVVSALPATAPYCSDVSAPHTACRDLTPEASLSSNYTATFLSGFSTQSPLQRVYDVVARDAALTEGPPRPSVQVAASICDRAFSQHPDLSRANTPSGSSDCVPDSLTRKRSSSHPFEEGVDINTKRLAGVHRGPQALFNVGLQEELSPTIADTIEPHEGDTPLEFQDDDRPSGRRDQMSQWINLAWNHCSTAHYTFIAELLQYGAALSSNQSGDILANCHVDCTLALLARCAKQQIDNRPARAVIRHHDDGEMRALLRWLYTLKPGVDMEMFPALLQLSLLDWQIDSKNQTTEGHDALVTTCRQRKAHIVAQACVQYGAEILRNGTSDIVTSMLGQGRRIEA
ncbi:hypothetical protein E4T38_01399 [Aureobasidium subglaciale]|nr:hypothetical protein E4T38_01399 [Aureobasidium subglaciale]KAI5229616.1 hypothetical protein E4T40_01400 [Aureobasidium subglaciale]KAI5233478.1 hypothetical protein E4T41_01397 [Aureobasidium subglaciale]KAI5266702.1 hypothetical protein E4T46_01399 [Aureobasidium subglaciale]